MNIQGMTIKLTTLFFCSAVSVYGTYLAIILWDFDVIYPWMLTTPIAGVCVIATLTSMLGAFLPLKTNANRAIYSVCFSLITTAVLVAILED